MKGRRLVWSFLYDGWPYADPKKWWMPGWLNRWLGERTWDQSKMARPYCWLHGHKPVLDMCNRPEHAYCIRCDKLLPYARTSP